jgi:type I restriction enzyme R subunit
LPAVVRESESLAEKLNLSQDEFAFYTALGVNDSAVKVLGDQTLRAMARIIAERVRANASIDWTLKESARAKLMIMFRRTLNETAIRPISSRRRLRPS